MINISKLIWKVGYLLSKIAINDKPDFFVSVYLYTLNEFAR